MFLWCPAQTCPLESFSAFEIGSLLKAVALHFTMLPFFAYLQIHDHVTFPLCHQEACTGLSHYADFRILSPHAFRISLSSILQRHRISIACVDLKPAWLTTCGERPVWQPCRSFDLPTGNLVHDIFKLPRSVFGVNFRDTPSFDMFFTCARSHLHNLNTYTCLQTRTAPNLRITCLFNVQVGKFETHMN